REPANAFVAGFVGTPPMNLLRGVVSEGLLQVGAHALPLPPRIRSLVYAGQPLLVGMRPEALPVTNAAERVAHDSAQVVQLDGVVEVVEPDLGRRLQWLHLRMEDQGLVASAAPAEPIYVGNRVTVAVSSDDLYFFDATSELRLG
ncbi:MAG TPA: hypothetical protein PKE45_08940, partial [Caldilineaceae bacterium]|nr:hypothetical protein [Caldilineaceae bacterium]